MTFRVIHGTNKYSSLTMMNIIYIWVVILNKVNQIDMYTIINMYTFSYLHVHIIHFFYQYIIDNTPRGIWYISGHYFAHANVASVRLKDVCCPSKSSTPFRSLRMADISTSSPSEGECLTFTLSKS